MPFMLIPIVLFLCKKEMLKADLLRYKREVPFPFGVRYFCYVLLGKKEYRSVFAYRCHLGLLARPLMFFVPPLDAIEILTYPIGPGMRLFHKSGCAINAESIGSNFTCGQGVVIGIGKEIDGKRRLLEIMSGFLPILR